MHPTPSTARQTIQICIYRERESEHWNVQFVLFVNICDLLCFGLYSGRMLAYNYMCVYGSFGWCSFLLFWFDFLPLLLSCWYSVRMFFFFLLSSFMCMLLYKSVCVCVSCVFVYHERIRRLVFLLFFFLLSFRLLPYFSSMSMVTRNHHFTKSLQDIFFIATCFHIVGLCYLHHAMCDKAMCMCIATHFRSIWTQANIRRENELSRCSILDFTMEKTDGWIGRMTEREFGKIAQTFNNLHAEKRRRQRSVYVMQNQQKERKMQQTSQKCLGICQFSGLFSY